jgi:hypothetical protein
MDDGYSLSRLIGLCGGWLIVWITFAWSRQKVTLRMIFALVAGFAVLFALARPFIQ